MTETTVRDQLIRHMARVRYEKWHGDPAMCRYRETSIYQRITQNDQGTV